MCKFEDENSPGFDLVVEGIQRYAQEAQSTVKTRWDAEMETRNRQTQETVKELQIQAGMFMSVDCTKVAQLIVSGGTPQNESRDTSAGKMKALPPAESSTERPSFLGSDYEVEEVDRVALTR